MSASEEEQIRAVLLLFLLLPLAQRKGCVRTPRAGGVYRTGREAAPETSPGSTLPSERKQVSVVEAAHLHYAGTAALEEQHGAGRDWMFVSLPLQPGTRLHRACLLSLPLEDTAKTRLSVSHGEGCHQNPIRWASSPQPLPPETRGNRFLLPKPRSLQHFVQQPEQAIKGPPLMVTCGHHTKECYILAKRNESHPHAPPE